MTAYEQAIVEKLTAIAESLSSVADSLKKLGDAAEGDSNMFHVLGVAAFNPQKDGFWNCKHRTVFASDEVENLKRGLDRTVVGNAFICEKWKGENGG